MTITPAARLTAFFSVLEKSGFQGIHDSLSFHALEKAWGQHCGLRHSDLLCTVDEVAQSGGLRRAHGGDGLTIQLTDRGLLQMQRWLQPFAEFNWANPLVSLSRQLHTARVLRKARARTAPRRSCSDQASTAIQDRRSMF